MMVSSPVIKMTLNVDMMMFVSLYSCFSSQKITFHAEMNETCFYMLDVSAKRINHCPMIEKAVDN